MKNHQLIILIILIGIYSAGCAQVFTEPEPLTLLTITSQTELDSDSILILDSGQRLGEGRSWDIS